MSDASDGVGTDGFIVPEMAAAGLSAMARARELRLCRFKNARKVLEHGIQRCRSGS